MSHFPDVKLCLTVQPPYRHRQFAFVWEKELKDTFAGRSILAQVTPIHSQQLRRHYWIEHFALDQSVHGTGSDRRSQNQWADPADRRVAHAQ
jgi:hypothetical protein